MPSYEELKDYATVAASQTAQALTSSAASSVGNPGDVLERMIIVPATTGAGSVSIQDGSGSAIPIFVTGTLTNLSPIVINIGARSKNGPWKVTTGANVSAVCIGRFT